MADVTKHALVPKHIKISDKEKDELLKKYGITKLQLPRISVKDPAIKHLELKKGEIVKITRKSETTNHSDYYRVVINA